MGITCYMVNAAEEIAQAVIQMGGGSFAAVSSNTYMARCSGAAPL